MAPSAVHDWKTLVRSRHPGIVIESHEPEPAEALVQAVARTLGEDGLLEYFPPADNRFEIGGGDRQRSIAAGAGAAS